AYADKVNEHFDAQKPWELAKDPARRDELHRVCSDCIAGFYRMTIFLKPVLPALAKAVEDWLGTPNLAWSDLARKPTSITRKRIGTYAHLMNRIDPAQIDALLEGPKAAVQTTPDAKASPAATTAAAATNHMISIDDFTKVDLR